MAKLFNRVLVTGGRPAIIAPTTFPRAVFTMNWASRPVARSKTPLWISELPSRLVKVPNSMTDARYYNIKGMQGLNLQ